MNKVVRTKTFEMQWYYFFIKSWI